MARILYVAQGYSTHDRRFLGGLRENGHEVWFLPCSRDPIRYESRPVPAGVQTLPPLREGLSLGPLRDAWISVPRLRAHVRRIKPQVVHAGPVQTGAFFCALAGCRPLLVMSWGSDILVTPDRSPWLGWVTRFTLSRAQWVLADCRAVRDRIIALSNLPAERIVTLPYGVDLKRFDGKMPDLGIRHRLGWEGCRVLISVRSLEPHHGTLVFLKALQQILADLPDVRALMLGDGSLRPKVEESLRRNGLEGRAHLAGQIREDLLPGYLREADLYVSASFSDGSSVSLLEAMAAGLPVIATDEPGNREWVNPGTHGWLTPAEDSAALAEAIRGGLSLESAARRRISEENRRRVLDRADWKRNFGRLTEAYRCLMGIPEAKGERVYA